jgi:pimeloyl-ACP methyl ester carboxylesterase
MKSKEGFVKSFDGERIFYSVKGEGLPMVCCNGVGVSRFFWKYITEYFTKWGASVITWDYRGHGKSPIPKDLSNFSMETNAKDIKAILDELEIEKAILIGHSMGVQVILEFWHLFPERTLGLIPILGTYEHPANTFFDWKGSLYVFKAAKYLVERNPEIPTRVWRWIMSKKFSYHFARLFIIHPTLCSYEDMKPYFEHLVSLDLRVFFKMADAMQRHSARSYLRKINCPVLIIAGEKDVFTPLWLSLKMHKLIPNSEILILKQGSHAGLVEQPDLINYRIEKFIIEHFPEYIKRERRTEEKEVSN